jgi:hypothetical protein
MTKNRYVKTTDQLPIFSALEFGIDALSIGSRINTETKLEHRGIYVLLH